MVNTSVPATAGAETVHVNGLPVQLGLDVVRFDAIEDGVPVYAVPFTLTSVMTTDCVALEIYFGVRLLAFFALAFGTVIVKRALAFGAAGDAGDDEAIGAADRNAIGDGELPPPEQLASPNAPTVARMRLRTFTIAPEPKVW
jgi:hypothetical protein